MKQNVVIVDDEKWILSLLQDTLEEEGFAVQGANSLEEARTLMNNGPAPDLFIVDVKLPDGDGRLLLQEIRRTPMNGDVPVLLMTANDDDPSASSANGVLHKPFELKILKETVSKLLNSHGPA